jgi:hypothetical protein
MPASSQTFLSEDDVLRSIDRLAVLGNSRINIAFRFRNSLNALLRDVDRAQWEVPPKKIMAVDTTEVVAATDYDRAAFAAFSFSGLLVGQASKQRQKELTVEQLRTNSELETLDKLIVHHLLEGRTDQFLLTDAHAEEIVILRDAIARNFREKQTRLFSAEFEKFRGMSAASLTRIEKWITKQKGADLREEWLTFCNTFLPNWRDDMIDELTESSKSLGAIDQFIRRGNYIFLRPDSFGPRSLEVHLGGYPELKFHWKSYADFVAQPDIADQYEKICNVAQRLTAEIKGRYRSTAMLQMAAMRDARAIASVHVLNSFFHYERINARVELISRSPTLHSVISALPERALHVTLRHPLLIPDIYRFDTKSLLAIADILQRVDSVIRSYVTDIPFEAQGSGSNEREQKALEEASAAATEVVPHLRNILSIQQGLEQSPEVFRSIFHRTAGVGSRSQKTRPGEEIELVDKIRTIFKLVTEKLADRDDPFSNMHFNEVVKRNLDLIRFERARTFTTDEHFQVRLLSFEEGNNKFLPERCMVARPVTPSFGRLFHLYSTRIITKLSDYILSATEPEHRKPREVAIPIEEIFDSVQEAFESLSAVQPEERRAKKRDDILFALDGTLLACLAFASRHRFETVVTLASTILHRVSETIRRGEVRECRPDELRQKLAYRELFLLRHYCERGIAMDLHFADRRSFNDSKGSVSKNFARAQRDLDFAALMSEDAERCLIHARSSFKTKAEIASIPALDVAPSGVKSLNDYRLRLANFGSWMDQFLLVAKVVYAKWPSQLDAGEQQTEEVRRRIDIWSALALVREAVSDAHSARLGQDECSDENDGPATRRYLAHIEARALQGALTMLLIFLGFKIAPEVLRLWGITLRPTPDRLLVFRDWDLWWRRYRELRKEYHFAMRISDLIDPVCAALQEIEGLQVLAQKESGQKTIIEKLKRNLDRAVGDSNKDATFMNAIAAAIRERLDDRQG